MIVSPFLSKCISILKIAAGQKRLLKPPSNTCRSLRAEPAASCRYSTGSRPSPFFNRANLVRQKGKEKTKKGLASLFPGSKQGWHASPATWPRACVIPVAAPAECGGPAATQGFSSAPFLLHLLFVHFAVPLTAVRGRSQATWAADRRPPSSAVTHSNAVDSTPIFPLPAASP